MIFFAIIMFVGQLSLSLAKDQEGMDVSSHQPNVNWAKAKSNGISFAYIQATASTTYKNPIFSAQYAGASGAGILHGAYHVADPAASSGATQANYFFSSGGTWTADGKTLPGALEVSYGEQQSCYGLSASAMVSWIKQFAQTYKDKTGRFPVLYTSTEWWKLCTGNSPAIKHCPLWIARYAETIGPLPAGWSHATIWQYADVGKYAPGDADRFFGVMAQLKKFAMGQE